MRNDLSSVSELLSNLDGHPLVSVSSVSDCFRLGKFNDDKTRPILVKLTRSADVSVLSVLKERWELINNGISKTTIKIRGTLAIKSMDLYVIVNSSLVKLTRLKRIVRSAR